MPDHGPYDPLLREGHEQLHAPKPKPRQARARGFTQHETHIVDDIIKRATNLAQSSRGVQYDEDWQKQLRDDLLDAHTREPLKLDELLAEQSDHVFAFEVFAGAREPSHKSRFRVKKDDEDNG